MTLALSILATISAFFATLLVGIPLINAFSGIRFARTFAPADQRGASVAIASGPAFSELEMEPFTMSWPSEIERPAMGLKPPPWPSETWNDEFFGTQAKVDLEKMRNSIEQTEARAREGQKEMRKTTAEAGAVARAAKTAAAQASRIIEDGASRVDADLFRSEAGAPRPQRAQRAAPAPERQPEPPPKARPAPKPRPEPRPVVLDAKPGFQEPTAAEITEMVKNLGLAGAVEKIRSETGWDFKRAAQYLATILRESK